MSLQFGIFWRRRSWAILALGLLLAAGAFGVGAGGPPYVRPISLLQKTEPSLPVLNIKILKTYPHDPHAFTQGLEYFDGFLYESTGETGQSSVRKVDLESGKVLQKVDL